MTKNSYSGGDAVLYRRLVSYVNPYIGYFLLSVVGFIIYSAGNVLLADLTQFLLDSLGEDSKIGIGLVSQASHWIWPPGDKDAIEYARIAVPIAAVLLSLTRASGYFLGTYFMNIVARAVVHHIRTELFDVLIRVPKKHADKYSQGELVSKLTFNVEQLSGASSDALKTILRDGLTVIALITYMLYLNWRLSLIFLALAPPMALVFIVVGRHFRRYSRRIQDSMGDVTQLSNESMAAFDEIRMFAAQEQQSRRFFDASQFNRNQSLKLAFVQAVSTPIAQTLLAFALGALFWISLGPEMLANFSAGLLVAFIAAAAQLGKPIRTLTNIQSIIQRGLAAAEDVFAQIDTPLESDKGTLSLGRARGDIELRGVSFSYPGSKHPSLRNISFHISSGSMVALVGRSGAGKTTLIQLLSRFYEPDSGEITLDGKAIELFKLADYRKQFALVSQSVMLFTDTIRNNVSFGRPLVDEKMMMEALDAAHATGFILESTAQLNTVLGDCGRGLSGGQRQRLAIARAILKDSPILLLDEATSALDNESEAAIQLALDNISDGRTSIVIAHRLSTVERADLIVVMDQGSVVALGTHKELIEQDGLYTNLYQQGFSEP